MAGSPFTIVALGDCNTCGIAAAEGQTVPQLVAEGLGQSGRDVQLINLGLTMSTTREGLALLRDYVGTVDLLLVNYGLVDAWTTSLPGVYISYYPERPWKALARKCLKWAKRQLRSPLARRFLPVGQVVPVREYEANLREILNIARSKSPDSRAVLWATAPVHQQPARNVLIERYNTVMQHVAETTDRVSFCDAYSMISRMEGTRAYLDDVHLGPFSTREIAKQVVSRHAEATSLTAMASTGLPDRVTETPCERCRAA